MTFSPLGAVSPAWITVTSESVTHPLPRDAGSAAWLPLTVRMASTAAGADILLAFGREDVTVEPSSAILFPAGSLEVMALNGATHIAVMEGDGPPATKLNLTIGTGD